MHSSTPTDFPLAQAPLGTNLMVTEVELEGADAVRLQAMGICRGRRIELVKGGDPMIVRVLGTRVGLAGRLAARVMVRNTLSPTISPSDVGSRVA